MVERSPSDGKKSDMTGKTLLVVAGALQRADGLWLMHRRPLEKHHGGLWEFPGGKVEPHEIPREAICRELAEELGVAIRPPDCEPLFFADDLGESADKRADPGIVILLYRIECWAGEPRALEGGAVDWFEAAQIHTLDTPPLDQRLIARLFG